MDPLAIPLSLASAAPAATPQAIPCARTNAFCCRLSVFPSHSCAWRRRCLRSPAAIAADAGTTGRAGTGTASLYLTSTASNSLLVSGGTTAYGGGVSTGTGSAATAIARSPPHTRRRRARTRSVASARTPVRRRPPPRRHQNTTAGADSAANRRDHTGQRTTPLEEGEFSFITRIHRLRRIPRAVRRAGNSATEAFAFETIVADTISLAM